MGKVAHRYLASLSPVDQEASQQEINNFIRWYGSDRPVAKLTIPQVGSYAEQIARSGSDPTKRLEPVRGLLVFAKKQGFTSKNLSIHLRVSNQATKKKASGRGRKPREITLTAHGLEEKKRELESLKKERPKVQEEISRAAADKDVRENAPLEAAREHHGHLESRIRELEGIIEAASVMHSDAQPVQTVSQGNKVTIRDLESGEILTYALIDPREANTALGKISIASPVGKALLGKAVGEVVGVNAPAGQIHYQIEKIES